MKRISMIGVVASTAGSLLAASTVILSAGLAVASPSASDSGSNNDPNKPVIPVRGDDPTLDLPIMIPVYDPNPKPVYETQPIKPTPVPLEGEDPKDEPPPTFYGEEIEEDQDSILYVIDNSGSMTLTVEPFLDGAGNVVKGNRLDRAKSELCNSIASLTETFTFNVIFFDECTMSCWPSKQKANDSNKATAFAWINSVQPDGWTNTGLAVAQALQDKTNKSVVLLSDGSPNFIDCAMNYVGTFEQHRELIRNANSQAATINCFGIGIATDPDARSFMISVAGQNNGSYVEIN